MEPCLLCHGSIGIPAAWSANMMATQKTWPNKARRRLGVALVTRAQSNARRAKREGRHDPARCARRRPKSVEQHQWVAWMDEQREWRESERMVCWYRAVPTYWRRAELSRSESATRSRKYYHRDKKTPKAILKRAARNAVSRILRIAKIQKEGRTIEYLGCSMAEARRHIERQFKRGMRWENHGTVWHIDHIVPLSRFDLTDRTQMLRANHFTNLQPMLAKENLQKGNRIIGQIQPFLL